MRSKIFDASSFEQPASVAIKAANAIQTLFFFKSAILLYVVWSMGACVRLVADLWRAATNSTAA
jgi:hypothetical protein